jgi:hypothetical protein
MGKEYDSITDGIRQFIEKQQMFFVATAPLASDGLVNVSPKGLDSFRILDGNTVAYVDLVGSGIETVAHLKENGRIVIMFCAFDGAPNIVRLYGHGEAISRDHADFQSLAVQFPAFLGLRTIVRVTCHRIADSCGFGVPLFDFVGQRAQLEQWAEKKGVASVNEYVAKMNATSLDGLPGLE